MDHVEMRNEFVVLYNNVMSNQAPGLNGYEISVFLTKGQDETLKNYFNPKGNKYQEGEDDSPKRQIDFSNLTVVKALTKVTDLPSGYVKIDPRSQVFNYPMMSMAGDDTKSIMFVLNEYAVTTAGSSNMSDYITVKAVSYQEYQRLMSKPYKWPVCGEAWRLIQNSEDTNKHVLEVICKEVIPSNSYFIRYIRKPRPIIVEDLGNNSGVSINGYTQAMDCELDSIIHEEIVQRAVELAKAAYIGDLNATIQMGQRSE
jgi:hypothetical protein